MDVFFNTISVQPSSVQDSQDKRAAPKNVLAPTRIAYAGDQTDFVVDMGLDVSPFRDTRLEMHLIDMTLVCDTTRHI